MIVTFILGSAFAIFSVFGEDSSKSFLYLFGNYSLTIGDLFSDPQNSKLISVCINQDGDLANRFFNLSGTGVDNVAQLYNASLAIDQTKKTIANYTSSIAISTLKSGYQSASGDTRIVTFPDLDVNNQIAAEIDSWAGWSDSNKAKQMSQCGSPAMDLWFQNNTNCPSGYTETPNSNPKANLGSKSCLIIKNWDSTSVNSRYSSYSCSFNSDFTSASNANNQYYTKMSAFIDQNTALLNQIISDHDNK
jgi:hypothetical protein